MTELTPSLPNRVSDVEVALSLENATTDVDILLNCENLIGRVRPGLRTVLGAIIEAKRPTAMAHPILEEYCSSDVEAPARLLKLPEGIQIVGTCTAWRSAGASLATKEASRMVRNRLGEDYPRKS